MNKCKATNTLCLPVLTHTFGSVKWNVNELQDIDRKTRKVLTKFRSLHPNASIQRLYFPRTQGGRALLGIEDSHNRQVISAACKIADTKDHLLVFVREHERNGKGAFLFETAKRAAQLYDLKLDLTTNHPRQNDPRALEKNKLKDEIKNQVHNTLMQNHMAKNMHCQYYKNIEEQNLNKTLSFGFLSSPGLYSETEGYITACQDGVYASLVYRKVIMKQPLQDTRCRACRKDQETTMHLLAACSKYAPTLYITRHDMALRVVYFHFRHMLGIDEKKIMPYQEKNIPSIISNDKAHIYWNFPFSTTAELSANKPDMVVLRHDTKDMLVVEMSCPAEKNIEEKELEKITKYRDLIFQLKLSYPEYKIKFIPLIIGVLGGSKTSLLEGIKQLHIQASMGRCIAQQMLKIRHLRLTEGPAGS